MPELRGSLVRVTASPSTAVGVLVRAPEVRAGRGGLVLTEETQVPVDRGEFTVELEPGPAVMTVQHAGYPGEVIPLLVVEGQTNIAEAMQAASIADGAEKSEIEQLLAEVVKATTTVGEGVARAENAAAKAEDHRVKAYKFTEVTKQYRDQAEAAKDAATTKADEAAESKRRAWQFFSSAQNFSDKAAEFKDQAEAAKAGAESAQQAAETAKGGAVDAQHAAEAAAQVIGKPSGGWSKSDLEQAVQSSLTDVENATHQGQASQGRNALARFSGDGQLYVGKAKYGVSAARKDYVDDAVQGLAAQLNAAKDELSAGIAAASFITGIVAVYPGDGDEVHKIALGSATQCTREVDDGYVLTKSVTVFGVIFAGESIFFNSVTVEKNGKLETFSGASALYLIIGQPQD